jgi:hypothetical protein
MLHTLLTDPNFVINKLFLIFPPFLGDGIVEPIPLNVKTGI